jgi:hypothetical protein
VVSGFTDPHGPGCLGTCILIDRRNDRAKFVDAFWNIVNWDEIGKRLAGAVKGLTFIP